MYIFISLRIIYDFSLFSIRKKFWERCQCLRDFLICLQDLKRICVARRKYNQTEDIHCIWVWNWVYFRYKKNELDTNYCTIDLKFYDKNISVWLLTSILRITVQENGNVCKWLECKENHFQKNPPLTESTPCISPMNNKAERKWNTVRFRDNDIRIMLLLVSCSQNGVVRYMN